MATESTMFTWRPIGSSEDYIDMECKVIMRSNSLLEEIMRVVEMKRTKIQMMKVVIMRKKIKDLTIKRRREH